MRRQRRKWKEFLLNQTMFSRVSNSASKSLRRKMNKWRSKNNKNSSK
jgi:hypothetical protein